MAGRTRYFKGTSMQRKIMIILGLFILNLFIPTAQAAGTGNFTAAEMSWIKSHPVVTYTTRNNWPLDYYAGNQHLGLSRSYLNNVEKQTGLKFVFLPEAKASATQPMMQSEVYEELLTPGEKKGWLFTSAWMNSIPMIVIANEKRGIRSFEDLGGKNVAISAASGYTEWLKRNHPEIHLIIKDNFLEALRAVDKNEGDAAIGTGLIALPILQRNFAGSMSITAQPPELATGIQMAVRDSYPELQSILNKSFANMSGKEVRQIYEEWVGVSKFGMPTVGVIWEHYQLPVLAFIILLLLLIGSLRITILSKRQAQRSEQQKGDFLAMMSHEIRTPMNAVIASLELLRKTAAPLKRQQYIDLAYSSSQNLLELLNSVLDHSKLSQKRLKLERNVFELSEMLEAFIESQHPAALHKGLQLKLVMSASLRARWIVADAHRLRQIVTNLCSNAIKFTHQGSVILEVTETLAEEGLSRLTFTVTDTGIGIPAGEQSRLFEAWEQMEGHSAQPHGGSGLGLFICNELVRLMQGEIHLASEVGKGTAVSFTISVEHYDGQPNRESTPEIALPHFLNQVSVLIVEDHPANQKLLKEQLEVMGCLCEIAGDGEKAVRLLEEENYYDLILLDCNLPGHDGYEVAKLIRQLEHVRQNDRTPIVAISALNTHKHFERCIQNGMDDVLTKPIRLEDLADVLRKWFKATEGVSTAPAPQEQVNQDVLAWLYQDAEEFRRASETKDLRYLIHYMHRMKGVALMYQLHRLADYCADCEMKLRSKDNAEAWPLTSWASEIENLIAACNKDDEG